MEISELAWLNDVEYICEEYESLYGLKPINVSDWNPSLEFKSNLKINLPKIQINPIDYVFSYELDEKHKVLKKLGSTNKGGLITHSGSSAIIATISVLREKLCKNVLIICPHYFTVPYALRSMGLNFEFYDSNVTKHGYEIPYIKNEILSKFDVVWITNPVYCTSIKYSSGDLNKIIENASTIKFLVVDECLNQDVSWELDHVNLIRIVSPHKSVCVNGVKFGSVIFPKFLQNDFDDWSDVWQGCLPESAVIAIHHYLSDDFEIYKKSFNEKIYNNYLEILSLVSNVSA